jgi:hypothetical protein
MRLYPQYPASSSYIKFKGFLIKRDAAAPGGDFVTYIKDVKVIYDLAEPLDADGKPQTGDIDNEAEWGIRSEREEARARNDLKNFGLDQVYRFQQTERRASQDFYQTQPSAGANDGQNP